MIKWHFLRGIERKGEKWEGDNSLNLMRASIPGGWLVASQFYDGGSMCLVPTFVPDPDHTWDGTSTDYDRKVDG